MKEYRLIDWSIPNEYVPLCVTISNLNELIGRDHWCYQIAGRFVVLTHVASINAVGPPVPDQTRANSLKCISIHTSIYIFTRTLLLLFLFLNVYRLFDLDCGLAAGVNQLGYRCPIIINRPIDWNRCQSINSAFYCYFPFDLFDFVHYLGFYSMFRTFSVTVQKYGNFCLVSARLSLDRHYLFTYFFQSSFF